MLTNTIPTAAHTSMFTIARNRMMAMARGGRRRSNGVLACRADALDDSFVIDTGARAMLFLLRHARANITDTIWSRSEVHGKDMRSIGVRGNGGVEISTKRPKRCRLIGSSGRRGRAGFGTTIDSKAKDMKRW